MAEKALTVVICTHNRASDLRECLAALAPQMSARMDYLVVDSGSAPDQQEEIRRIVAEHPSFRLVRVDEPGLSRARNVGLGESRTEWMALLDDDAVPAPDWTHVALELLDKLDERYAVVGGAVHPLVPPDAHRPHWGRRWLQLISAVEAPGEYDQTDHPQIVGANMWFRVAPLRALGGFPANLGRIGTKLLSGEDKLVVQTLTKQGRRIWYSDRLQVGHKIHRDRLSRRWACSRAFWDGISDRRIQRMSGERVTFPQTLSIAVKALALAPLYFAPSPEEEYFLRFWYNIGWVRESWFEAH